MIVSALTLLLAAQEPAPAFCSPAAIAADAGRRKTNIYRTPTIAAGKVGKLDHGTPVYVCGSRGNWLWVHFAQGRRACRGTRQGLELRNASTCAKGWVERRRVAATSR